MMTITDRGRHCLSFIGARKARNKRHEDDNLCRHLLCLKGMRQNEEKATTIINHHHLLFFIRVTKS